LLSSRNGWRCNLGSNELGTNVGGQARAQRIGVVAHLCEHVRVRGTDEWRWQLGNTVGSTTASDVLAVGLGVQLEAIDHLVTLLESIVPSVEQVIAARAELARLFARDHRQAHGPILVGILHEAEPYNVAAHLVPLDT